MSIWTSLLSWAIAAAKTEGQSNGLKALQTVTDDLNQVIATHAPDMAPVVAPLLQQMISSAVAGIMTKK